MLDEPGADMVAGAMRARPFIASINVGEVAQRLALLGLSAAEIADLIDQSGLTVVDVDRALALEAGFAAPVTKSRGLSLGDRVCLMLAKRLDLPALTGDRSWLDFADDLGVQVELIR